MKRIALTLAACGLLAAGCSDDGGSETASASSTVSSPAATTPTAPSTPAVASLRETAEALVQLTSAGAPLDEFSVYLEPSCTDYLRQFESQMGPSPSTVTAVDEATGAVTTMTTASGTSDTMIWTKASGTWLMTCP